jgi:hypothetical protein
MSNGQTNINFGSPEPVNLGSSGDLVTVYAVRLRRPRPARPNDAPSPDEPAEIDVYADGLTEEAAGLAA